MVYITEEDSTRIGQPGRETLHHPPRNAPPEAAQPAAPGRHRTEKLLHVAWAIEESKHAPDAPVEKLATL